MEIVFKNEEVISNEEVRTCLEEQLGVTIIEIN